MFSGSKSAKVFWLFLKLKIIQCKRRVSPILQDFFVYFMLANIRKLFSQPKIMFYRRKLLAKFLFMTLIFSGSKIMVYGRELLAKLSLITPFWNRCMYMTLCYLALLWPLRYTWKKSSYQNCFGPRQENSNVRARSVKHLRIPRN